MCLSDTNPSIYLNINNIKINSKVNTPYVHIVLFTVNQVVKAHHLHVHPQMTG